jgi:predicted transcriptional regulator YdeE
LKATDILLSLVRYSFVLSIYFSTLIFLTMETNVVSPEALSTKEVAPKILFYSEGTTTLKKINEYVNPVVEALLEEVKQSGLEPVGPMEFIYLNVNGDPDNLFTLQIALPVKEQKLVSNGFLFRQTEAFKCVSHDYKGDVTQMHPVYDRLFQQMYASELKHNHEVREVYKQWEHPASPNNITEIQIGIM